MWRVLLSAALGVAPTSVPDEASVKVPNIAQSNDPAVIHDGYKFYFFHNPSVTFKEAFEDFRECRSYLTAGAAPRVPGFVPFGEEHRKDAPPTTSPYGLVGGALLAIIEPKMERGVRSTKMRRCMGTRGYVRYPVSGSAFDALNSGDEATIIATQAKLATSPKPNLPQVTE